MNEGQRYQPQIDGLRAVAIIPVIFFHAGTPGLRNGFIGVDIFFVLSGFLITRLLLTELGQTGTINLYKFYARRVRRILPALTTVVAITLLIGTFILSAALERQALSKSAIATMAFISNLYFWRAQDIYFAPPSDWIPLLNMWTLSVEEQLYLVWPMLLILTAQLGRLTGRSALAAMLPMVLVFTAISFGLFFWGAYARQTAAFYLTPARAWEFTLGGALALAGAHLQWIHRGGGIAAIFGFALIVIGATTFHSFFLSVASGAFGTTAMIAGIIGAPGTVLSRILQTRPMVIIGKLSYSWYLWHWPLLAYSRILAPGNDNLFRALCVVLGAFVLAALTYVLVENPIRRNQIWPFSTTHKTLATGFIMSVAVLLVAVSLHAQADIVERRDPWLGAIAAAAQHVSPIAGCTFAQTFTFEELASPAKCSVGAVDAPLRLLVWGDSQAEQLLPMMEEAGEAGSYRVVTWSMASCATVVLGFAVQRGLATACRAFNAAVTSQLPAIAQDGVTGIILATRKFGYPDSGHASEKFGAWRSGMNEVLAAAHAIKARVLLVAPIPVFSLMVPECLTHASPERCGERRTITELERAPLIAGLQKIAAGRDDVRIWDPLDVLCGNTNCTPMRDGMIMYSDRGHLSKLGARALTAFAKPDLDWLLAR